MKIDIGKDVIASDGEKIGKVDRLVIDSDTNDLSKFIVHKGMFWSEDKIVDLDLVSKVDADGNVHLRVPSDDEDTMPAFVEETHRVATDEETTSLGYGAFVGIAPYAPIMYAPGGASGQYRPGSGPFFEAAETGGVLEHRTNLPEDSMTIDKGTDVVGSDGDKVGEVEEIIMDANGKTTGFVVKSGFIFTNDVQIPMDLVDHMSGVHIALKITADEAKNMHEE
jgi:sporulation protein YlmC with PRC-barrel domain